MLAILYILMSLGCGDEPVLCQAETPLIVLLRFLRLALSNGRLWTLISAGAIVMKMLQLAVSD